MNLLNESPGHYADIILPLAVETMTYAVPDEMVSVLQPGSRVIVPLGRQKFYTGTILRIHNRRPDFKNIKPIARIVDATPVATPEQLKLWSWMADYYLSTPGLVMRAALPAKLKPKGFSLQEAVDKQFKPATIPYLRLHPRLEDETELHKLLDSFKRAKARHAAVIQYLTLAEEVLLEARSTTRVEKRAACPWPDIPRHLLSASGSIIRTLLEQDVFVQTEKAPPESGLNFGKLHLPELSPQQDEAYESLKKGLAEKPVALLHGITGSGKTEIYVYLIAEALQSGGNVLYLLPEIALTAQLIERMQRVFGEAVIVYHSRLTDNRRANSYENLLRAGGGHLIMGVRSSVLLPTPGLSLVIVDEEHENSFKQTDSSPRYHARDTAIVLASLYGAKTVLGSATPSLESYYNARSGKYAYIRLSERYSGVSLPKVLVSDIMRAAKRGEKRSHFTHLLLEHIDQALMGGHQVMLFQNRRGFSPYVECGSCGWIGNCPDCNVTLTYHKNDSILRCHYCGHCQPVPSACPSCATADILPRGFGTEKVEEELSAIFPEARIDRLDADTTRTASGFNRIVRNFEQGLTDILVGTQMITKGFDFGNVTLVGILNADNLLNYPDFRAGERAFQLMTQVGGRAGRREEQGTVIIQTTQPQHPIILHARSDDYEGMAGAELAERQSFFYPPYCRLISLTFRHKDKDLLWRAGNRFGDEARMVFGRRLMGPEAPPVDRIQQYHLLRFLLKIEKQRPVAEAKRLLSDLFDKIHRIPEFKYVEIIADIDPQ